LPTNAHFSSNWTSRVRGGKSHEFVVDLAGVGAGDAGQSNDRVLVHPDEATGLSDPAILLQMPQHGDGFFLGEFAAVEGTAFAFGKALPTSAASEDARGLVGSVAETDPQIIQTAAAVVVTVGVLTTEDFQVVHGSGGPAERKKRLSLG
jgi:hypothetical protein